MGKKKYNTWLGDPDYDASRVKLTSADYIYPRQSQEPDGRSPPKEMLLPIRDGPGFFLGLPSGPGGSSYIGIPQNTEGNFMVVGGNGSGKSAGIAKPTLKTWQGPICATDVKGELSLCYEELSDQGLVTRPYLVFVPTQPEGPGYDPLWLLSHDGEDNLLNNVREIAMAIAPVSPEDKQPFWAETEQGVVAAALLYYFKLGLSFSEIMCKILSSSTSELCKTLVQSQDVCVRILLGEMAVMKPETLANIDRGMRNKLMLFAADPYISHAFRGQREGASCFNWSDLDHYNIFLRIPADKIDQWSGAINLMYIQLIRHLERRPEKYSAGGASNRQTLLLMDEFARFGKLPMITAAMATLRSKNVNICLMVQSVAQLDKIYGEHDRRIIFDNCQFQAILRANDADTQKYLCELVGTHICSRHSTSEQMDEELDTTGYNRQTNEVREWVVQPHELSTLEEVLVLSPYGSCRVKKLRPDDEMCSMLSATPQVIRAKIISIIPADTSDAHAIPCTVIRPTEIITYHSKKNEGAKIMSIEERTANANRRIDAAERKRRQEERAAQEAQKKKDNRRSYAIGELVAKYFPQVSDLEQETNGENTDSFEPLEAFLYVLSIDYELVEELKGRAAQLVSDDPDGEWRAPV